ncbi:DUF2304 family protein [Silanimonas lenta]|uniref:DUF2304 family protein n=1 Tax=Silanimonas lenta TaxID=265429 RepID=UPI003D09E735
MISYVLTLLILPCFLYAFRVWRVSRLIAFSLVVAACLALGFVWSPVLADHLARLLGVGRGADLVIYVYCSISFLLILDLALKLRVQQQMITRLAREIALDRALRQSSGEYR